MSALTCSRGAGEEENEREGRRERKGRETKVGRENKGRKMKEKAQSTVLEPW